MILGCLNIALKQKISNIVKYLKEISCNFYGFRIKFSNNRFISTEVMRVQERNLNISLKSILLLNFLVPSPHHLTKLYTTLMTVRVDFHSHLHMASQF